VSGESRLLGSVVWGSVVSILGSYPLAALCALVFRFPIPFAGYESGIGAVLPSVIAVTFYLVMGGFFWQGAAGAAAGALAWRRGKGDGQRTGKLCIVCGLVASFPGVFILAILDKIIGPW